MLLRCSILLGLMISLAGCGPSTQQQHDSAVRALNRAQERLDALRPAYDAARQTATLAVCKEIAGVTPEESAAAALKGLNEAMTLPAEDQAADKKQAANIDDTIDKLIAAQQNVQEQQATLTAPIEKANEVMKQIKTPGSPEAEKFEEALAKMPEVQAYERQQKRVEEAQQAVDETEAALP